jgi:RimJ/RimL family protein N-acetyltransferase
MAESSRVPSDVVLETARLTLRPLERDDLGVLAVRHAEPSFWKFPYQRSWTRDETAEWLARTVARREAGEWAVAAVIVRASGALAGWAGLSVPGDLDELLPTVEVGWRLGRDFWGHGYATEAGRAWVDHGFGAGGLDELISIYEPANVASGAVMARLGFRPFLDTTHPGFGVPLRITRRRRDDVLATADDT